MQAYHVYYTCTYIKITDDQGMVCFLFRKFQGDNVPSYKKKKKNYCCLSIRMFFGVKYTNKMTVKK